MYQYTTQTRIDPIQLPVEVLNPELIDNVSDNMLHSTIAFVEDTIHYIEVLDDDFVSTISKLYRRSPEGLRALAHCFKEQERVFITAEYTYMSPTRTDLGFGHYVSKLVQDNKHNV